jgi:glycosyltransferase involved in cell wall biosynthesis
MKIAVIHSFYSSDAASGENTIVDQQVALLADAGHDVHLMARRTDDEEQRRLYPLRAALTSATSWGHDPGAALDALSPDVILVHNLFPNWGRAWLKRWGRRSIATLHNHRSICAAATLWRDGHDCTLCPDGSSLNAVRHACYRGSRAATIPLAISTRHRGAADPVLRHAAALVVLNRLSHERYQQLCTRSRIELIPNFALPSGPSSTTDTRTGWLFVGRLTEEKGLRWLRDHWPAGELLTIVGDGPLRDEVASWAAASPNRFTYLGRLPHTETLLLHKRVQGLVIPSLWSEGLPTVTLESLSAGTPVVVSSSCGAATDLVEQGAGLAFDPNEPDSLLRSMILLAQDPHGSTLARQAFDRHYSPEAWLTRIEPLMADVAEG